MADSRVEELRRRIERDPGSRLFAQLAEQLRKEGELEEAIGVARAGLQRHPNYPSARLTLGRALLDSGDPAAARTELEAAVEGAPDNILASRLLGEALETLGDLGAALLQYRRTLEMAPSDRHVEARIQAIQGRLGAPPGGGAARAGAAPSSEASPPRDVTKPMSAVGRKDLPPPGVPETQPEGEGLPPTIRIRMPGDPVGGIPPPKPPASGRPPVSTEASRSGPDEASGVSGEAEGAGRTSPGGRPPLDERLPATLPGRAAPEEARDRPEESVAGAEEPAVPAGGDVPMADAAKPAEDSDLAPTLPSSKAAEYAAAADESVSPTVPPGMVTSPVGVEAGAAASAETAKKASVGAKPPDDAGKLALPPTEAVPGEPPAGGVGHVPPAPEPATARAEPPTATPGAAPGPEPARAEGSGAVGDEAGPGVATGRPVDAAGKPLSSGTLAELYFQQGLLERAVEVYREVLAAEPGNATARTRLAEIEAAAAAGPPPTDEEEGRGRAARRRALERTIERLEALLAVVQRR